MKTNTEKKTQSARSSKPQKAARTKRQPGTAAPRLRGKSPAPAPTQLAKLIKVGLDVGLKQHAYCRQVDDSRQDPPRMSTPEKFQAFILTQKAQAQRVVVCYEAGCFGFTLARWLKAQGIECLVMSPVALDERHRRVENDKLNAQDIGSRLDRYLAGNTRAMTVCRVPTLEEELARTQTRERNQLIAHRKALQAQGRSLLWQFGYLSEGSGRWWEATDWKSLSERKEVPPTLIGNLERLRGVLGEVQAQLKQLEAVLAQQAQEEIPTLMVEMPKGVGYLSMLILTREIMDWDRFGNRRQVSCWTGLVPSESSTGQSRRVGSVTKVGNPLVRAILVEMAWRLVRYQPNCHAVKPWLEVLENRGRGAAARKRAIVAVARVLAVDLWRLATGQTTAAQLGFRV